LIDLKRPSRLSPKKAYPGLIRMGFHPIKSEDKLFGSMLHGRPPQALAFSPALG